MLTLLKQADAFADTQQPIRHGVLVALMSLPIISVRLRLLGKIYGACTVLAMVCVDDDALLQTARRW